MHFKENNFNHIWSGYIYTTPTMEMICNNGEYSGLGIANSIIDAHSYTKQIREKIVNETNYPNSPENNYRNSPEANYRNSPETNYQRNSPEINYQNSPEATYHNSPEANYRNSPETHDPVKEESNNRVYSHFFNYGGSAFSFNNLATPESNIIKKETVANSPAPDPVGYNTVPSLCQTPPSAEEGPFKKQKELKFPCSFCNKMFAKKQQLQNHTKTHTGEKNFKCDTCEKSFIHKQQLTNHQKIHSGQKDFKCSFCAKDFMLKQQLQIHEKIHTGEKNYGCTMCEKAFITKQQLQNHINSHLGIKPFTCSECNKKFAHKQQLERHTKNHALKQNYSCIECNRKFLTKTSYNEHHTEFHAQGQQLVQNKTLGILDHSVETFIGSPC